MARDTLMFSIPRISMTACRSYRHTIFYAVKQPIVLPKVPANVSKKLGFKKPLIRFGGVNFAVKVVIATSIISMPVKVIMKPTI